MGFVQVLDNNEYGWLGALLGENVRLPFFHQIQGLDQDSNALLSILWCLTDIVHFLTLLKMFNNILSIVRGIGRQAQLIQLIQLKIMTSLHIDYKLITLILIFIPFKYQWLCWSYKNSLLFLIDRFILLFMDESMGLHSIGLNVRRNFF